jgi:hypothetical protein
VVRFNPQAQSSVQAAQAPFQTLLNALAHASKPMASESAPS